MRIKIFLLILVSIALISCSKDDSNPADTTNDTAYVGTYTGTNSDGKDVSITIGIVNGKANVTKYNFLYTYTGSSGLKNPGTAIGENSVGLAPVNNASFSIVVPSYNDNNSRINGTFTDQTTLTGDYRIDIMGNGQTGTGTFTLKKK